MRNLKDSEIEWLGDIPQDWSTKPLRAIMDPRTSKNVGLIRSEYLSLLASRGVIPYEEKGDIGNKSPDDLSKCKLVDVGDFVLNSMNFGIGSFGVSRYRGICSQVYVILRPKEEIAFPDFLKQIFQLTPFQKYVQSFGNGILEHRAAIGWDELKNLHFPLPPMREQEKIAGYLEMETKKIDELINKQKQLIEFLEERRKATILKAVTKGLDSSVEYVDSGIAWLGLIPAKWELRRLRHFASLESGKDYKDYEVTEEGYPVMGSGGEFARVARSLFCGESVLFGRKGTINKPLYVNTCFWTVDTMYYTRISEIALPKYVYYWATTIPYEYYSTQTALPSMTSTDIKSFAMPFPPKNEQVEIVKMLDYEIGEIDHLIGKTRSFIELSIERRQALIAAAVTGKLELGKVY